MCALLIVFVVRS